MCLDNSRHSSPGTRHGSGFTLVEVMVVVVLLSLIVYALMMVFSSTQAAFRSSVTQAGVLDDGRAAMDLMASDLRAMTPSRGFSTNSIDGSYAAGPVNFAVLTWSAYKTYPVVQPLVGGGQSRTNVIDSVFILTRQNTTWTGVGYAVDLTSTNYLYPLYRFSMSTNVMAGDPALLLNLFLTFSFNNSPNWSRLMDGVVGLTARAYDPNGNWINNAWANNANHTNNITFVFPPTFGEAGFYMRSNTLPASVQIEMGVLEDRALQRAESLNFNIQAQSNYLSGAAGTVHVFRQRVTIPNVDPSAYQ
jgi:prepilin-type N-terminal cleavage/methylation domain-containing protein